MKLIYLTLILSFFVSISLAQPANDDPCEATSLTVGGTCSLTSSTSAGATNTTGFGAPSCSIYSNKDVWFSFVAPGSGNITIKSTIGTITDGAMSLYSGPDCSTLSEVECDDDDMPPGSDNLMPMITRTGLSPGATYWIRFWRYSSGTGTFNICVYEPTPPTNDNPCSATPLSVSTTCSYTTGSNEAATATSGVTGPGCGGYSGGDVWFSFTIPVSGVYDITALSGTLTDGAMAIYSGTCSSLSLIACDDNTGAGSMPYLSGSGTGGSTIWIRFWEFGGDVSGDFQICVTELIPPANDNPCSATPLTVSSTCSYTTGSNDDATATSGVIAPGCGSYGGGDVWFSFTVPISGLFDIATLAGTITDGAMAIYSGTCSSLSLIACDDNTGAGSMPYLSGSGTAGSTIWIRFWEFGGDVSGDFQICVTEIIPPSNDDPCAAEVLPVNYSCTMQSETNLGASNTSGVTTPSCGSYSGDDVWYELTVPASGTLIIESISGTLTNIDMALYSGTCSGLTEIACDAASGAGMNASITYPGITSGSTVWLRVWDFGGGEGTFNLCANIDTVTVSTSNNDCTTATQLCSTTSFDDNSNGNGITNDLNASNSGCLSIEHQSAWYYFQIETSGTLTFTINPDVNGNDFDFGVWGPASSCPPSADPVRCSYAISGGDGNTGLNTVASDVTEDTGGDRWLEQMNVIIGEIYILCVDNFSASNQGFTFSFGGTATINCEPIVLPVELISFTATANQAVNILNWITATEINTNYFSVEHSENGTQFNEIGEINAAGNSTDEIKYEFTDNNPAHGINYYRLKKVDMVGKSTLSNVISVNNLITSNVSVYPNPSEGFINVVYSSGESEQEVTIHIFTAYGQPVYDHSIKGNNFITEKVLLPAKGMYWVIVQCGEKRWVEKVTY